VARFGRLLDLPEHPHKGDAQTDDDAQKHQRQGRGCEHGEHPEMNASSVPADGVEKNGLGEGYTKAAGIVPARAALNFI
jgi:hypothetical protein